MLRIFTDFDGPIMDVSERYYQVYLYCLAESKEPEQSLTTLSKEEFWHLKRAQVPERQIGALSGLHDDQARRFALLRRENVHAFAYLKYDRPISGAIKALKQIQALNGHLLVITMRREKTLNLALAQHGLADFFPPHVRYCLPDEYVKTHDVVEKTRLMTRALTELPAASQTWVIGDTEADIAAAHAHQFPIIAVLSGIRDRDRLLSYHPDFIVEDLQAAADMIQARL